MAKDDTDETRLLRRGAAAVVGVGAALLANAALPPLVLAWPPRAPTPPELREAQVVVIAARIVSSFKKQKLNDSSLSLLQFVKERRTLAPAKIL